MGIRSILQTGTQRQVLIIPQVFEKEMVFFQGLFCDVEILCGGPDDGEPSLNCHSLVLGLASPALRDALMLSQDDNAKSSILVPDQSYFAVRDFLARLYGVKKLRPSGVRSFRSVMASFSVSLEGNPLKQDEGKDFEEELKETFSHDDGGHGEDKEAPKSAGRRGRKLAAAKEDDHWPPPAPHLLKGNRKGKGRRSSLIFIITTPFFH